jgi:hypothetical protein
MCKSKLKKMALMGVVTGLGATANLAAIDASDGVLLAGGGCGSQRGYYQQQDYYSPSHGCNQSQGNYYYPQQYQSSHACNSSSYYYPQQYSSNGYYDSQGVWINSPSNIDPNYSSNAYLYPNTYPNQQLHDQWARDGYTPRNQNDPYYTDNGTKERPTWIQNQQPMATDQSTVNQSQTMTQPNDSSMVRDRRFDPTNADQNLNNNPSR